MFNGRYMRKLVLLIFTVSNISLVYLIYGEITLKKVVEYDQDDLEEHPGEHYTLKTVVEYDPDDLEEHPGTPVFNNTTFNPTVEDVVTMKTFTMPPIYRVNATDPNSHRKVLAETFNPEAYYNVDLDYLNQMADKAFKEIQLQCEGITMARAKRKSNATGIPLCSCAPNTLGEWQIVVFNTQACL